MGELDRDVRRQLAPLDLLEHTEVMIAHLGGIGAIRHLFAELREHGAEVLLGKCARGFEGIVECLTRHEAADGALKKPALAQLPRKPLTP